MLRKNVLLAVILAIGINSTYAQCDPAETKGIVPIQNYTGDFTEREYLTGDWGGQRTSLAQKGVQVNVDWTNTLQSVVDGGLKEDTEYTNTLDYAATLDLMKMGVLPGAVINFKAESRFGRSVNGDAGSILPVNTDAFFPLTNELDDDITFTITNLNYTQFLSEKFALTLGKFDVLDADLNEFASGRGTDQFMNANFLFNAVTALRMPYSTLGGGFIWLPSQPTDGIGLTIKSLLISTADSSETTGFDNFNDGWTWSTEANAQYKVGELPGGQNLGLIYSFDQSFGSVGDRFVFQPGQGLSENTDGSTWALFWSGWQYLVVNDPTGKPVDVANRKTDHQGFGLFGRAGIADKDTNPSEFSVSGGLGGRGVCGRENDTYGLGYYYSRLQETRLTGLASIDRGTQGFEAYYSIGITPGTQFTLDMQIIDSILSNKDDAYVLGGRLRFAL